jgi:hypothetical protein
MLSFAGIPQVALSSARSKLLATNLEGAPALEARRWFSLLCKPVDMIVVEHGLHELQRPWERMISQQANVDWFTFWLKSEEDPDPATAEQYAR